MNRAKNMRCTSSICEQSLCKVLIKMNENFWSYRLQKLGAPKVLRMDGRSDPRGVLLFVFAYVGSDPASTLHPPKNIRNFKCPKNIWNFCNPKKYPDSVYLPKEKTLKYIEKKPLKLVQFGDDPKKISTKFSYPKNIHFSGPQKNSTGLRMYENIRVPPLGDRRTLLQMDSCW